MATHSSVLAWRIPGMAEPGGLPSMGSHGVRHDWSDLAATVILIEIINTNIYKSGSNFLIVLEHNPPPPPQFVLFTMVPEWSFTIFQSHNALSR